jgi:hypothetical protein
MFDQRRQERFDMSCRIEYVADSIKSDTFCEGIAINVSNYGLCLLTSHSIQEGQEIIIKDIFTIPLPAESASVVWVEKYDDLYNKIGLAFS